MSEVFGPDSVFAGDKVRDPPAARGQFERVAIRECCLRVLSLDVAFLVIYKYIHHQHVVGKEPESSYFWSSREPATLSKGTQHPILKLVKMAILESTVDAQAQRLRHRWLSFLIQNQL